MLQDQIDKARSEIRTDAYSMSIGELISLYESREIDIHPEFQRFFRWSDSQKTRLIESILLGIPIPQIFVSQREDGIWDVVDGLQRLSTIYQFVGILRDEKEELLPPLVLESTKYLSDLDKRVWEEIEVEGELFNNTTPFTTQQRLLIKRAKLDISIILRESDDVSKYELFQRLNTGGSPLSDQEVRNAILVMMNKDYYQWLRELSNNQDFKECLSLTDRAVDEQYDMDLALRFVLFRTMPIANFSNLGDINDFLTTRMIEVVESESLDLVGEKKAFEQTFSLLNTYLGSNSMNKYDHKKDKFIGGFLVSAFEVIALGVGYNYQIIDSLENYKEKIINIWDEPEFISSSGSGIRASTRLPKTIQIGRDLFSDEH